MMKYVMVLLAATSLAAMGESEVRRPFHVSETGGEWHAPSTWLNGRMHPGDNDLASIVVGAPLTLATGTVTAARCFLSQKSKPTHLKIGPLAHMCLRKLLYTQRDVIRPVDITVEGSLMLQGGANLYGNTTFSVKGGFAHGMGQLWVFAPHGALGPIINVSDGGTLTVRKIRLYEFSTINIDNGNASFEIMEFEGATTINIQAGTLVASEVDGSARVEITLGEAGQLLLPGRLDTTSLRETYPRIAIFNRSGEYQGDSLICTPGTGRFVTYTCITLPPADTDADAERNRP